MKISSDRGDRWRWILLLTLLALLTTLATRCDHDGQLRSARIVGDSMAESRLGAHVMVSCQDCRYSFACSAAQLPMDSLVICPNCGFADNNVAHLPRAAGERVTLDRNAFVEVSPSRWEVVAVRDPNQPSRMTVKRVVGLPGEQIELRHGDVFVDGKIARKTLDELRSMAIFVHDADHPPTMTEDAPLRWDSRVPAGTVTGVPELPGADGVDYRHMDCSPLATARFQRSPIWDYSAYNQALETRAHYVTDVLVRFSAQGHDTSAILVVMRTGVITVDVTIDLDRQQLTVGMDGAQQGAIRLPEIGSEMFDVEVAWCDQQVMVGIDGQEVLRQSWDPGDEPFKPSPTPIRIGWRGGRPALAGLHVSRDVYYLNPGGANDHWVAERRLENDEFFLLGDNPPISVDGRNWIPDLGSKVNSLLGKVLSVTQ